MSRKKSVSKNSFTCKRCGSRKEKRDFEPNAKNLYGIDGICKDCSATDFEVQKCKKGDKLIYTCEIRGFKNTTIKANVFGDDSEYYYFIRLDEVNDMYCWISPNKNLKGYTKIYIPYVRKYRSDIDKKEGDEIKKD